MVTRVQLTRYSGRAEKDLAFRVDHKLCRRREELRGSGIRVERVLQDSGFHSREAPCGALGTGLRRGGIMDTLGCEIKQLKGRRHQVTENKIQIWNWDVPTVTKSKEKGWGMRTDGVSEDSHTG